MNSIQATYEQLKELQQDNIVNVLHQPTIVEPSFSISKVIDMMIETDSYDVYCINKGRVLTTNAREMLDARDIIKMKISSSLHRIEPLSKNDTVGKAAAVMVHYRMRSFPVVENSKISGVVTAKNIVNLLSRQNLKIGRASCRERV